MSTKLKIETSGFSHGSGLWWRLDDFLTVPGSEECWEPNIFRSQAEHDRKTSITTRIGSGNGLWADQIDRSCVRMSPRLLFCGSISSDCLIAQRQSSLSLTTRTVVPVVNSFRTEWGYPSKIHCFRVSDSRKSVRLLLGTLNLARTVVVWSYPVFKSGAPSRGGTRQNHPKQE